MPKVSGQSREQEMPKIRNREQHESETRNQAQRGTKGPETIPREGQNPAQELPERPQRSRKQARRAPECQNAGFIELSLANWGAPADPEAKNLENML